LIYIIIDNNNFSVFLLYLHIRILKDGKNIGWTLVDEETRNDHHRFLLCRYVLALENNKSTYRPDDGHCQFGGYI